MLLYILVIIAIIVFLVSRPRSQCTGLYNYPNQVWSQYFFTCVNNNCTVEPATLTGVIKSYSIYSGQEINYVNSTDSSQVLLLINCSGRTLTVKRQAGLDDVHIPDGGILPENTNNGDVRVFTIT
jgi:hypothetical protein